MKVKVELWGGLELLFQKQKEFLIDLGDGKKTIADVIKVMEGKVHEKPELFTNKEGKM